MSHAIDYSAVCPDCDRRFLLGPITGFIAIHPCPGCAKKRQARLDRPATRHMYDSLGRKIY